MPMTEEHLTTEELNALLCEDRIVACPVCVEAGEDGDYCRSQVLRRPEDNHFYAFHAIAGHVVCLSTIQIVYSA